MVSSTLVDGARSMGKKWMKKAVPESHKGIFTAKAKAHGESVHEYAEQEKDAGGKLGKEANLALTFEKEAHKRKHVGASRLKSSMYHGGK